MNKKAVCSLLLVGAILFFTSQVSAIGLKYWAGTSSSDWLTPANWVGGTMPTSTQRAMIGSAAPSPTIIGYDRWASVGEVYVGYEPGQPGTLTVDHFAGLDINNSTGDLYIGVNTNGYVYIRDGFIWCGDCYVNAGGWGQLEIHSGGLSCENLYVAGRVNLYGFAAYVETNNLEFSGDNKAIELKHGRIVWYGDHQTEVQNFISQGLIYCEGGTVLYDYDFSTTGATTVYATTKEVVNSFSWSNQHNKTISGKYIRNFTGYGIHLNNCTNITIEDCEFGPCYGNAIDTNGGNNITVNKCKFRHCQRGVWFWEGGDNMKVLNSWFLNALVRDHTYSHGIAMCVCIGTGLEIRNNRIQNQGDAAPRDPAVNPNHPGFASVSDNINTYKSEGTAASPLLVENNWIKNWDQMEFGGCGITTGDQGGAYNEVRYNRIVNPQYGGISIAGGDHAYIHDNIIFGDKNWNPYGGAGIVVQDWVHTGTCGDHTVIDNDVSFWATAWNFKQCKWTDGSCGTPIGWNDNNCSYSGTPDDFLPGNIFYECENPPTADMDDDCMVNMNDVGPFADEWMVTGSSPADYNGDNNVNMKDFRDFGNQWLDCGYFPPTPCP